MAKGAIKAVIASQFDATGLLKAQKQIGSFGKTLKGALGAVGLGVGLSAISNQLQAMAKGAVEDAKSQAQLAIALKNTTNATDAQISANEDFIAKTALATNVLDSQLRPALASLVRVTGDAAQAQSLLQLSLDVSAGTGKDLESVSKAIGKAFDGNSAALSRLVPGVQKGSGALADLQAKFKGAAAAAAANDPYGTLKIAFDQIGDTVGAVLLPIIRDFAKWIADMTPGIVAFFNQLGDPTTAIGNAWLRLAGTIVEFGKIFLQTGTAVENGNFLTTLFKAFSAVFRLASETVWVLSDFAASVDDIMHLRFGDWFNRQATYWDRYNTFVTKLQKSMATPFTVTLPKTNGLDGLPDIPSANKSATAQKTMADAVAKATAELEQQITAYWDAVKAAEDFYTSTKEVTAGFVAMFKIAPKMGEFEQAVVTGFQDIYDTIKSALKDNLILKSAGAALTAFANTSIGAMQAIAKQRDVLAGKIDVARTITAGVTGLANITSMLDTVTESVTSSVRTMANGIETIITRTTDVTTSGGLVDNFQKLVDKTKKFAQNLIDLKKLGLNKNLFAQLVNAGADAGSATADALVQGGSDTIVALNDLYRQLDVTAGEIAQNTTDVMYEVGQQIISNGFIEGLVSQADALTQAAQSLAQSFADAFNKQMAGALQANLPALPKVPSVAMSSAGIGGGLAAQLASMGFFSSGVATSNGLNQINAPASVINLYLQAQGTGVTGTQLAQQMIAEIKKYERANGAVWQAAQ